MRKKIAVLAVLVLFCFVAGGWNFFLSAGNAQNTNALLSQKEFVRFHVIANSDSPFDQNVKLKVRDKVLEYLSPQLEGASSVIEAKAIVHSHREAIIEIANRMLTENGANYLANIDIGVYEFPVKSYGAIVVPAGNYQAVRILLGEALGKNWWCVLFPPLCFIDINSSVAAQPVAAARQASESEPHSNKAEFKWMLYELLRRP